MDLFKFAFMHLTFLLFSGAAKQDTGNFPLPDCHTGQFDILLLPTTSKAYNFLHTSLSEGITNAWITGNRGTSRVHVSKVNDTSATSGNNCSVKLTRFDEVVTDLCSSFPSSNFSSSSLHVDIKLKLKMATSIFTDMDVGRQNSTHVVVIIYDSSNVPALTTDEIRRVPDILHGDNSGVKVFIIVHGLNPQVEPIFLMDLLLAGSHITSQHVSMALCKQCLSGWFQLEYKETRQFLSCYQLHVSPTNIDWFESSKICAEEGQFLAAIESKEELDFLRSQVFYHLLANRQLIYDSPDFVGESGVVYIGLNRDSKNSAKRFQWILGHPNNYRPLVLNHWLPGSPIGGFSHACGIWSFSGVFNYKFPYDLEFKSVGVNNSLLTDNIPSKFDGWSSVGCGTQLSPVSLCEVTLPRHIKEQDIITVVPASKDSFIRALTSGDFLEYEGNIVSVSTYANNKAFLNFLKAINKDFPMFDCGEYAGNPRYIAYTYIYDNINHCSNGRDEELRGSGTLGYFLNSLQCFNCDCIPDEALCDHFLDCEDGEDERECDICNGILCCDGTCLLSHMFNDGEIDCNDCLTSDNTIFNDESRTHEEYGKRNETCVFICNRITCIYPSQLNDGILDCTGPEGPLDESVGKLEKANSCVDSVQHLIWAPKCVFLKDRYGYVLGCRDLSHLQNCSDFPCQEGYYKCPGSYCIPLHYVMDGKSDCPAADEERHIVNYICVGNFACWNSSLCLHPDLVCDGAAHCPHMDDEVNCGLSCIDGLRCAAGTITVDNINSLVQLDDFKYLAERTRYIDLSGVDLSHTKFRGANLPWMSVVKLSNCKISNVDIAKNSIFSLWDLDSTFKLDLSFNLIVSLNKEHFYCTFCDNLRELNLSHNKDFEEFVDVTISFLEILDLSYTRISYLDNRSFYGIPNLLYLRLTYTRISTFHRDIFPTRFTLETLDLRGSPIVHFSQNTYNGLVVTSALYTDNFGLCCPQVRGTSVPDYTCHAPDVTISSCFDLIGDETQKILIWLMAGIALIGNLIIVLYTFIYSRCLLENEYGLLVLNLGISDLLMGMYLCMIAIADAYYRGVYVLYDRTWRDSVFCQIAGFLITLSSETSILAIFLITVDKYLAHKFSYGQRQFSRITKIGVISLSWVLGFITGLISVLPIFGHNTVFTSTSLCNGLLVINHRVNGWEIYLHVFIFLYFIIPIFTAVGHVLICRSVSENTMSNESTNQNVSSLVQNTTKQLYLVVLSNLCCSFPVGLMDVFSLSGHEINKHVYAWTAVVIVPAKSAVNPLLYIFPLLMKKWEQFKYGNYRPH